MTPFSSRRKERDGAELAEARRQTEAMRARNGELDAEMIELRKENRELKATVARLDIKLKDQRPQGSFVERHGVLWHQSADGAVEPYAYCPHCRLVMTPFPSGYPDSIICTQCKFKAAFHPKDIPALVEEMRR